MRPVWNSRHVVRLGAAMAGLVAAATIYFWSIVGSSPTHTITNDLATQTYPWRHYVTQELFAGRFPQWTPYSGFGFPFLADIETTVLYPLSLLGSLVSWGSLSYRASVIEDLVHYPMVTFTLRQRKFHLGLGIWLATALGAVLVVLGSRTRDQTGPAH